MIENLLNKYLNESHEKFNFKLCNNFNIPYKFLFTGTQEWVAKYNGTENGYDAAFSITSGLYFYKLETDKFSETKRMILLK